MFNQATANTLIFNGDLDEDIATDTDGSVAMSPDTVTYTTIADEDVSWDWSGSSGDEGNSTLVYGDTLDDLYSTIDSLDVDEASKSTIADMILDASVQAVEAMNATIQDVVINLITSTIQQDNDSPTSVALPDLMDDLWSSVDSDDPDPT